MTDELYWQEFDAAWRAALVCLRSLLGKPCTHPVQGSTEKTWS